MGAGGFYPRLHGRPSKHLHTIVVMIASHR